MNESSIRALVLDVDGVLTDGRLWYGPQDEPLRAFHVHDGLAIAQFIKLGGAVIILTAKSSQAVARRAADLRIPHVIQGSADKLADLRTLLAKLGISLAETAMIGDDLPDLAAMRAVGCPIAVANAAAEIKAVARIVTNTRGGEGGVREAIETLLRGDGRWQLAVEKYGGTPTVQ